MGHRHFRWLLFLTGLFVLRVVAQLIQAIGPVSFLPPFDDFQGSTLPYGALLAAQSAIIAAQAEILRRVRNGAIRPRAWQQRACFALGGVYFTVMAFRLVAGRTFLADVAWFSKSIPAFFHVVLASFLLTLGHYLRGRSTAAPAAAGVAAPPGTPA